MYIFLQAGARGEATATCDVTVHVTDVNDNSPRWSEATPTVVSHAAGTRPVISLTATDPDDGQNGTVTFSLLAGNRYLNLVLIHRR